MSDAIGNWIEIRVGEDKYKYFVVTGRIEKQVISWSDDTPFKERQIVKSMVVRLLRARES